MASNKTKFFRVAVEGATVDGREIKRDWLTQMARHYDPAVYGARVNVEHIKGYAPMSGNAPFGAYGDVLALRAAEIEDGPLKGKLALYAQIDPTDDLVALSKKRQKLYTSIEINPAFADIGEAYLVGLAATDDPASLGTEVLRFAAKRSTNLFSAACETAIEFEREDRSQDDVRGTDDAQSLLSIVRGLFSRYPGSTDQRYADMRRAARKSPALLPDQPRHRGAALDDNRRMRLGAASQRERDETRRRGRGRVRSAYRRTRGHRRRCAAAAALNRRSRRPRDRLLIQAHSWRTIR